MKWIECGENRCTLLFLCQKVFSGINVLLSVIYNERLWACVCVHGRASLCASRLGLLSLHYTRAGSTPVLCPRSLPLPVLARNNELPVDAMGGWLSGSEVDSILVQITSQIPFKWQSQAAPCLFHVFLSEGAMIHTRPFLIYSFN